MICFKDLGCCFDLDNNWLKTDKVFSDIKPYVYESFEKNGNYLYLLHYGYHKMDLINSYLKYKFAEEQNLQRKTIYAKIDSRKLKDFEQQYYETLFFDEEKQVYNLKIYTTYSNLIFSYGCIDCYFQDYEELEEMKQIFFEKFSFMSKEEMKF